MAANGDSSKKPSDASSPSPPERLVFFVDRSLGRKIIPDTLRAAGEEVRVHDDFFPQNAKDEVWLTDVGRRGWVVLTKDKQIRYREVEIHALLTAKVRAFILTARGDLSGAEVGQIFVKALPAMKKICETTAPPFIARVNRDSTVSLVKR
jgi:predicted nuclease of predicted toxin-antitoxin system